MVAGGQQWDITLLKFNSRQRYHESLFLTAAQAQGFGLVYAGSKRALVRCSDGIVVFDISMDKMFST